MMEKPKLESEVSEAILEVRFIGESLVFHGIPIYELGTAFISIQRMVYKAYLVQGHRWERGLSPNRSERERLALQIGARRRGSDWFSLLPIFSDPTTLTVMRRAVDYVIAGLTSYAVGTVLDAASLEPDEQRLFIGAIHADTVNVVNRIGNVGGCEHIQISSPALRPRDMVNFDASSRDYVRALEKSPFLGAVQTIEGEVIKLYPNDRIVEIRRRRGRKCKVFLERDDFDLVRYGQTRGGRIRMTGRPRFRIGGETRTFSEFEGMTVVLLDEKSG